MTRGFAAVGLCDPKWNGNIGGAIRAASCYRARLVVIEGPRVKHKGRVERTDPRKSHNCMPVIWVENIIDGCPHESVPIAVEMDKGGVPLTAFYHPKSAFYIFGGEDRSLSSEVLGACHHVVYIPTDRCMNLAATVNVVLYDRMAKEVRDA